MVEVISNRFVSPVFNVRKVFFEAGVKGASSFIVRQWNCFVMFIWDLGPVTLVLAQIKGHVPDFD